MVTFNSNDLSRWATTLSYEISIESVRPLPPLSPSVDINDMGRRDREWEQIKAVYAADAAAQGYIPEDEALAFQRKLR